MNGHSPMTVFFIRLMCSLLIFAGGVFVCWIGACFAYLDWAIYPWDYEAMDPSIRFAVVVWAAICLIVTFTTKIE